MTSRFNPFPSPTPFEQSLLRELVLVAERCYDRGWTWGTAGNFSIRGQEGIVWQSATGICKRDLKAEMFIPLDLQSEKPLDASTRPSAEAPVHLGIYKAFQDAKCVVHGHPQEVVSSSNMSKELVFSGEEMIKALGSHTHKHQIVIPVLENPDPSEMMGFSKHVTPSSSPVKVLVLSGHGVYAWGRTPLEALAYLEALEFLCQSKRIQKK
jgi:methylthioribulose-1-phosphate dehydratase